MQLHSCHMYLKKVRERVRVRVRMGMNDKQEGQSVTLHDDTLCGMQDEIHACICSFMNI